MQGASPLHFAVVGWISPSPNADFEEFLVAVLEPVRERNVRFHPSSRAPAPSFDQS